MRIKSILVVGLAAAVACAAQDNGRAGGSRLSFRRRIRTLPNVDLALSAEPTERTGICVRRLAVWLAAVTRYGVRIEYL